MRDCRTVPASYAYLSNKWDCSHLRETHAVSPFSEPNHSIFKFGEVSSIMSRWNKVFLIFCLSLVSLSYSQRNVRSAQDVGITGQLPSASTWEYKLMRHYLGAKRVLIFEGRLFDILLTSSSDLNSEVINFKLQALDTFTFQLRRQPNGTYRTENFRVVSQGSAKFPQDRIAEDRITLVFRGVNQFRVEDGKRKLIFYRGDEQILFEKLSEQYQSQSALETRKVAPESYFRHGKKEQLFNGIPFDIFVDTENVNGRIKVILRGQNSYQFVITYNIENGFANDVHVINQPQEKIGTSEQIASETKVKNIIANTRQIIFGENGKLEFIADYGNTGITFLPTPSTIVSAPPTVLSQNPSIVSSYPTVLSQNPSIVSSYPTVLSQNPSIVSSYPTTLSPYESITSRSPIGSCLAATRQVARETYFKNGVPQKLHKGAPFDIFLYTEAIGAGIRVTLRGINTYKFEIFYNNANGRVSKVSLIQEVTAKKGTPDQIDTENEIKDIIERTQQIACENDHRIQFIAYSIHSSISFLPTVATTSYQVIPYTYQRTGRSEDLYSGLYLPITIQVSQPRKGFLQITLQGLNTFRFDIHFNANGEVHKAEMKSSSNISHPYHHRVTENKVVDIIRNARQVGFYNEQVVFVAKDGSNVTFEQSP